MISDKCEVASGEVIPELCDGLFDGKSISLHGSIALFRGVSFQLLYSMVCSFLSKVWKRAPRAICNASLCMVKGHMRLGLHINGDLVRAVFGA